MLLSVDFSVLDEQNWDSSGLKFDVVTCLNVLDRCDTPLSLLRSIKNVLNPDGIAVVAFVIPFSPYVEFGELYKFVKTFNNHRIELPSFERF